MNRRCFLANLLQSQRKLGLEARDIAWVLPDLTVPEAVEDSPRPGLRVRVGESHRIYHTLYLPHDWQPSRRYPVLVEYPGNGPGPLRRSIGASDRRGGTPEDTALGYGLSGGHGFLWLSLPFVDPEQRRVAKNWWGNPDATVDYCCETVSQVCSQFSGDPDRVVLCGFSRGSIACNYIGLRNAKIAKLWRAFFCHSHYDGVYRWPYPDSDKDSAIERLGRLGGRPQFISHESSGDRNGRRFLSPSRSDYVGSAEETRRYIEATGASGDFEFHSLPYSNHTADWVLRPILLRSAARSWLQRVLLTQA